MISIEIVSIDWPELKGALAASDGTITLQSIFIYTKYFLCGPLSIISEPLNDVG